MLLVLHMAFALYSGGYLLTLSNSHGERGDSLLSYSGILHVGVGHLVVSNDLFESLYSLVYFP